MAENNTIRRVNNNHSAVAEFVKNLEVEMLKHEQAPCSVYHHFSPGLYIREVNLPAGIFAIGHHQKTRHLNIMLKGSVSILNNDGSVSKLEAPMIFTGEPGRKCGYVHEDVVWLNVYPTEETDIEKLEETYLDKSDNWYAAQPQSGLRVEDREDYYKALEEYGFNENTARAQSENPNDQIPFPSGSYQVGVFPSPIEGRGLFATGFIGAGTVIAPARINGKRTPAGRYTNHAKYPNAAMQFVGDDIYLIASRDIPGCRGGQLGEEITIDYRQCFELQGVRPCQQ